MCEAKFEFFDKKGKVGELTKLFECNEDELEYKADRFAKDYICKNPKIKRVFIEFDGFTSYADNNIEDYIFYWVKGTSGWRYFIGSLQEFKEYFYTKDESYKQDCHFVFANGRFIYTDKGAKYYVHFKEDMFRKSISIEKW